MSGVFGLVDRKSVFDPDDFRRMSEALRVGPHHRVQAWCDDTRTVGLGQVNIGLFSSGRQPVHLRHENLTGVFFGEIYRAGEQRCNPDPQEPSFRFRSDAERVLHLYRLRGKAFLEDLEGVFVLAIWDGRRRKLLLANDRLGLIPIYYAHYKGRLSFGPGMKAILSDPSFERTLDLTAMAQFLRFQRLLADRTYFQGIHLLPYGSVLEYGRDDGDLRISHYWDYRDIPSRLEGVSLEEAVEQTGYLMRESIRKRTSGKHRIGVYLSGGLDSRTIAGLAAKESIPFVTLTYGIPGSRDVRNARRIARRLGVPNRFIPLDNGRWITKQAEFHLEMTEGQVTWTHCHLAETLEPAREMMDVNLTGFYGDQLLGARGLEHSTKALQAVDDLSFAAQVYGHLVRDYAWPGLTESEEKLLFAPDFYTEIRDRAFRSLLQVLEKIEARDYAQKIDFFTSVNHSMRLTNMNEIYQRAFLEVRYPFCDHQLVDWVFSLPTSYRLHDRLYMSLLTREVPAVTWVPRDVDGRLPTARRPIRAMHAAWIALLRRVRRRDERIIHEDPEGWLRKDLMGWAEGLLLSSTTLGREFYNAAFLRSLLERHRGGREEHIIGKIAPIMTYEMMLRRFYDQPV